MSLCDTCIDPGHCCRNFLLTETGKLPPEATVEDAQAKLDAFKDEGDRPYPFKATKAHPPDEGETDSFWWFTCPKLGPDGRCTIYETRPTPCRLYEPASDGLCVHYKPEEGPVP